MAARRAAQRADAQRVDAEFRGVRPQPAHRRFAILQRRGKAVSRRQPISHRHRHVAMLRERDAELVIPFARAGAEAAAVDADHRRERPRPALRLRQIELEMLVVRMRKLDAPCGNRRCRGSARSAAAGEAGESEEEKRAGEEKGSHGRETGAPSLTRAVAAAHCKSIACQARGAAAGTLCMSDDLAALRARTGERLRGEVETLRRGPHRWSCAMRPGACRCGSPPARTARRCSSSIAEGRCRATLEIGEKGPRLELANSRRRKASSPCAPSTSTATSRPPRPTAPRPPPSAPPSTAAC